MFDRQRLKTDVLALALMAATVFVALCLASYDPADPPGSVVHPPRSETLNTCGPVGALVAHGLHASVGMASWFVLFSLGFLDFRLFARKVYRDPYLRAGGWLLLVTSIAMGLRLAVPGWGSGSPIGSGGYLGAWGVTLLEQHLSTAGTTVIIFTGFVVGMLLTSDFLLFRLLAYAVAGPYLLFHRLSFGKSAPTASVVPAEPLRVRQTVPVATESMDDAEDELSEEEADEEPLSVEATIPLYEGPTPDFGVRGPIRVNPPITAASRREELVALREAQARRHPPVFKLPTTDLLEHAQPFPFELLAEKARISAGTLEKTFREFGLNVRVVEIDTGPVITQYELELEAGLRLSKVTVLADDLAIALRVPSVRVVAPIPGKNTVGVEVPNDTQVMVRLRELIEACPEAMDKKRIPVYLGKDVSGRPLVVDLAKMPHLLIAGRTGTGKSVCLNTLILSILMSRTPDQVKMLLIDPKMVELSPYKRVPHLMHPVITDMRKAEAVLAWAVDKMEERYDLLARCGVRHLDSYNELGRAQILKRLGLDDEGDEAAQIPEKMPYIVIVADEMADMMMTSGKDVEGHIIRLAQKSRAVGIHLVLATQKPTVDVITGLIKSNLPARISFQVASRVDSRVVLDEMGAERLLGNGDMLYLMPGTSKITRAQGTYVSDNEVNQIIEFFGDCDPQYSRELTQLSTKSGGKSGIDAIRARDELYEQAIDVVVREGRGSTSLLQRALGIGYGRAARLIDYMAEDGIVGDYNGSQAREVLYTPEQWAEIVAGSELEESPA
ncbi:MAG: DNA translocase FtsK [Planctomycetaceae bacterium]|nr:DNA translocase FtsK [Planctomycetaceae bacterium]